MSRCKRRYVNSWSFLLLVRSRYYRFYCYNYNEGGKSNRMLRPSSMRDFTSTRHLLETFVDAII